MTEDALTPEQEHAEKIAKDYEHEVEAALLAVLLWLRSSITIYVWWSSPTWAEFEDRARAAINPVFNAGDEAGKFVWLGYDSLDPATVNAQRDYQDKFVKEFSDSTKRAISNVVSWGSVNGVTGDSMERLLAYVAGLNSNQVGSVLSDWLVMQESGATAKALNKMLTDATKKALSDRSKTIAGDALWSGIQLGQVSAGDQEQRATNAAVTKEWRTAMDERVCGVCGPLHRVAMPISEEFKGGFKAPPAHSNCRCFLRIST